MNKARKQYTQNQRANVELAQFARYRTILCPSEPSSSELRTMLTKATWRRLTTLGCSGKVWESRVWNWREARVGRRDSRIWHHSHIDERDTGFD
jgi:hypothetical protein